MAATDAMAPGSFNGANVEIKNVVLNGTTAVTFTSRYRRVVWAREATPTALSNPTYRIVTTWSGATVSVKCDHDGETATVRVLVLGVS